MLAKDHVVIIDTHVLGKGETSWLLLSHVFWWLYSSREREIAEPNGGLRFCIVFLLYCDRICHSTRFCVYQQFVLHSSQSLCDSQCLDVRIIALQETGQSFQEKTRQLKNNIRRAKLSLIASLKLVYTRCIRCRAPDLDHHTGQTLYNVSRMIFFDLIMRF